MNDLSGVRAVLFVCLGDICHSPLTQGVIEHMAIQRVVRAHLTVESCGTGAWHVGEPRDPRTIGVARKHGARLTSRARQLAPASDFARFDLLLAMDGRNLASVLRAGYPGHKALLFRVFDPIARTDPENDPWNLEVPGPYHGEPEGVDENFAMVHRTVGSLLDRMFAQEPTARS